MCLNVEAPPPRPDQCELCELCEPLAGGALTSQRPDLQCEETAPAAVCRAGGTLRRRNVIISWRLRFTDPNCSVHAVAHSYVSPRHSELKLLEFGGTLMLGCDALSPAPLRRYHDSAGSAGHGVAHYTGWGGWDGKWGRAVAGEGGWGRKFRKCVCRKCPSAFRLHLIT